MTTQMPNYQPEYGISEIDIYTDFQKLVDTNQSVESLSQSAQSVLDPTIQHRPTDLKSPPSSQNLWDVKHSLTPFANWLGSQKLSRVSIKNYLSDLRHFLSFTQSKSVSSAGVDQISAQPDATRPQAEKAAEHCIWDTPNCETTESLRRTIGAYTDHLLKLRAPRATINRRLASIRKFSIFLGQTISIPTIPPDPVQTLLKSFRAHLVKKRHSPKTITNYLSDLRHYLEWATKNGHTVVTHSHTLSYDRVTTSDGPMLSDQVTTE